VARGEGGNCRSKGDDTTKKSFGKRARKRQDRGTHGQVRENEEKGRGQAVGGKDNSQVRRLTRR